MRQADRPVATRCLERLLLALVLLSQLALASVQRATDQAGPDQADLRALSMLCGAALPADRHHPAPHRQPRAAPPLCPFAAAFDLAPLLPPDPPWRPALLLLACVALWRAAPARAPPHLRRGCVLARGPPRTA